jgi:hypothetical protein
MRCGICCEALALRSITERAAHVTLANQQRPAQLEIVIAGRDF